MFNFVNFECEDVSGEDVYYIFFIERSNLNFESGRDDVSCGGVDYFFFIERSNLDYGSGRDDVSYGGVDYFFIEVGNLNLNFSEFEVVGVFGNLN